MIQLSDELKKELLEIAPDKKAQRWTPETEAIIEFLFKEGYSCVQISKVMKQKFPDIIWIDSTIHKKLQRMELK